MAVSARSGGRHFRLRLDMPSMAGVAPVATVTEQVQQRAREKDQIRQVTPQPGQVRPVLGDQVEGRETHQDPEDQSAAFHWSPPIQLRKAPKIAPVTKA